MTKFWNKAAQLPGLSPVTDFQAKESRWACYLTALHLKALKRIMTITPEDKFLDFGCGIGRITNWLAPQAKQVLGVDPAAEMIRKAQQHNQYQNVTYQLWDQTASNLPLNYFDGITAIWVFQHIISQQEFDETSKLLAASLTSGGSLYTIDRLARNPQNFNPPEFLTFRTRLEYSQTLINHGFELVDCYPIMIDEQIFTSPAITNLIKKTGWLKNYIARWSLSWSQRKIDPSIADFLWHFRLNR